MNVTNIQFIYLLESKSVEKPVKGGKEKKATRQKKDPLAPKKPMCAFFWYQRDSKNHITEPGVVHKDKIKVSNKYSKCLN